MQNYGNISTYVSKAEGVLDSYTPSAGGGLNKSAAAGSSSSGAIPASKTSGGSGTDAISALFRAGGSAGTGPGAGNGSATVRAAEAGRATSGTSAEARAKRETAEIAAKLQVANGLALLGLRRYEHAARVFLGCDPAFGQSYNNVSLGCTPGSRERESSDRLKSRVLFVFR